MPGWRDRFPGPDDAGAVPHAHQVLLRLTGAGARAVAEHARRRGMSRSAWIRRAIREQMLAEGAAHVPDLSPHTGRALEVRVEHER